MVAMIYLHYRTILLVLLLALVLPESLMIIKSTAADDHDDQLALPNCPHRCGNVDIPYPFGLSEDCSLNENFEIKCENISTVSSSGANITGPTPIFGKNIVVTNISVKDHEMTIRWGVAKICFNELGDRINRNIPSLTLSDMTISSSKNKFIVLGCDSYGFLNGFEKGSTNYSMGCMSICNNQDDVADDGSCLGIGCCQVEIPRGLRDVNISPRSFNNHDDVVEFNPCTYAFIVEQKKFKFSRSFLSNFPESRPPVVVDWTIKNNSCRKKNRNDSFCACYGVNAVGEPTVDGRQYTCKCKEGYEGNPYLHPGCKDINECKSPGLANCTENQDCVNEQGTYTCKDRSKSPLTKIAIGVTVAFIALFISGSWLYLVLKQRKLIQLKEKFFKQNGGILLKQKLSQEDNSSIETAKIFTEEELKKATLNYDESTVIGRGGFGTVYKGFLPDNRIVAIKKSKLVDQNQTEQFINEVVVLSQINHRNVVKLLGCCLETEVPLLVYEFVPNGTLSEHIHNKEKSSILHWKTRLRIAAETAEALSYLHSAASTPIIHRDVKPSNILLDNYTAKVSDFGASKLVLLDQIELATMVQGTLGYLDPEYLLTNQLTEKSDVYSFGVVLVELLTGKKAISFDRPDEETSLAMHFLSSFKRDRLFEIVEGDIVNEEGNKEQVEEVARLAKKCLNVNGEERPSMKEVAMELEGLRKMEKHPWANDQDQLMTNLEDTGYLLAETSISYQDTGSSNNVSTYDSIRDQVVLDLSGR